MDLIRLYVGISILALTLTFAINYFKKHSNKKQETNHEHDTSHYLKIFILLLIGIALFMIYKPS